MHALRRRIVKIDQTRSHDATVAGRIVSCSNHGTRTSRMKGKEGRGLQHLLRSNVFKRDFKVTTQSLMGKADIKKLRSSLMAEFPALTKKMLDALLSKDDIYILKCSNGRPPSQFLLNVLLCHSATIARAEKEPRHSHVWGRCGAFLKCVWVHCLPLVVASQHVLMRMDAKLASTSIWSCDCFSV
eukprot:5254770-Pleurochrysis_carterae.AAC.1